jgi:protein-L-isoaspartate O-methyltransferase
LKSQNKFLVIKKLLDQLKNGGRMFIPTGDPQQIVLVTKDEYGSFNYTPKMDVAYVPLTGPPN